MAKYTGPFVPAEFEVVQSVFKRVAKGAWFKDDIPTLKEFGLIVIHAYQGGIVDTDGLYAHCVQAANERFSQQTTQH
jgi:hypothetical protein